MIFIGISLLISPILSDYINVGGIFDSDDANTQIAFGMAINEINKQKNNYKLIPVRHHIELENPLDAALTTCKLMNNGVVGIFGPLSEDNSNGVQSVCDNKDVPHIETRFNANQQRESCLINLYPHPGSLAKVFVDLVRAYEWSNFTVLYEDADGLGRVSELLKMYDHQGNTVMVRQLDKHLTGNYRPALKEVSSLDETHFVLDCSIEHLEEILRQAQQVGLMTKLHSYIITNLDMQTIDFDSYQYSDTKITGVRMFNSDQNYVKEFAELLKEDHVQSVTAWKPKVETALMVDALILFARALSKLEMEKQFNIRPLGCNTTDKWEHGYSVINFMKTDSMKGLTGPIKFDDQGFRSDFNLDIIKLSVGGIIEVGNWSASKGLNMPGIYPPPLSTNDLSLQDTNLIVITALTDPYCMLKESQTSLIGNDRFEGFGIDLIHELSIMAGFNYTFTIREDKVVGGKDSTGRWSGMIGDLMEYEADLAIADITITAEREEAVDFTPPFMTSGIGILFQKPRKGPPNFFAFADPFALEVWLSLGGAYFVVSISLFIMGRLCASEWHNPYPCIEKPEFVINHLSLRNSFWFTMGGLMQQGTEIAPKAVPTRMVAGVWWFFSLIMVSSYTAMMFSYPFLHAEQTVSLFSNLHELVTRADKIGIKYGAKKNSATMSFFQDSANQDYEAIFDYMRRNEEDVMMAQTNDGVWRADEEQYAFFMESTYIEYIIQRYCRLTQVGGLLNEAGHGIAMRKESPYRNILSTAVLKLQASGRIAELKRKWWEEQRGGGMCPIEEDSLEITPLHLSNLGGLFSVTIAGTVLACFMVFFEMLLHVMMASIKNDAIFWEEFVEELKFYFKFDGNVKPVRMRKSKTPAPEQDHKSKEHPMQAVQRQPRTEGEPSTSSV